MGFGGKSHDFIKLEGAFHGMKGRKKTH